MSQPPLRLWLSAMVLCASASVADPVSAEELLHASPGQTIANQLFSESEPWIQTVSLQCTDGIPCDASDEYCDEYCDESVCCNCDSHSDCCGDLLIRPGLTNGLFGLASALADHGILVDASYTNFYQGVASGGAEQIFRYGGKTDLFITADTGKLGLWEGGQLQMHVVDWQVGQNSVLDAAGLAPVNTNLLTPTTTPAFGLTNLIFMQELGGGLVAQVGRYNSLDLWTAFYPDYGRGIDGFMNVSTMLPLSVAPSMPFISNVAGILKMGERGLESAFVVMESQNSPTTVGLDFPNGVTLLGTVRKYTDFGDLPGSHTLVGSYATGDYTSFDTDGWDVIPPGGVVPATKTGSWMAAYLAEQRLWGDRCNANRYTKLFGYVGFSDQENSPFKVTTSISAEAFGPLDNRPNDRMGVAYFYNGLNGDFKNAFALATPVDDLQGGEVYYNAQVTPWFNLTVDLQAVEPGVQSFDTAVVLGVRGHIKL